MAIFNSYVSLQEGIYASTQIIYHLTVESSLASWSKLSMWVDETKTATGPGMQPLQPHQ